MPPKKKDIKADKAQKLAQQTAPARSSSRAKSVDVPVVPVVPATNKKGPKGKAGSVKSEPIPVVIAPVVPVSPPKRRRGDKSDPVPVTVADPEPAKKIKGDTKTKNKDEPAKTDDAKSKIETKPTSTDDPEIVKVITKGGVAVDAFVPGKENYRVYQDSGKSYAATLNQANLDHNNNKFYIVQVLLNEQTGAITVWNRWGRVGVPGQNCMKGPFPKDVALKDYNSKVHDKTVKGDYKEIEIKYDEEEEKPKEDKKPKKQNNVASKMDSAMQKLISLIFDVNIMNNTMKEIGYDAKKMPLGKLGDNTIKEAYSILNELTTAIKEGKTSEYSRLSSAFYTLIPHDIGFDKMSKYILNNDEKVKEKLRMIETISDMKITAKLLDQDTNEDTSVYDQNYKKLGCNVKTLDQKSADFKLLKEYFDNTKGSFSSVSIGDIYEVERETEHTSYNSKLGNNMLLWHGSRIANFVGILSQGLRIAPPEAPVSGYLFGKGIYLADLAEKSIHYCRSHGSAKALILLIEGAIGNPNILLTSSYQAKELMERNGKHSTKCHGRIAPPESSYVNLKGMIVPNGKAAVTNSGSYMGHNEYIVYNMNQARIRYILEMNM